MPSYDYRCHNCKVEFTVERSMKDESQQHCLECGGEDTGKIWTAVAIASGGSTMDYGQGTFGSAASTPKKSACGSCISKSCGTCH